VLINIPPPKGRKRGQAKILTCFFQFQDVSGKSKGGIGDIFYSKLVNGGMGWMSAKFIEELRPKEKGN